MKSIWKNVQFISNWKNILTCKGNDLKALHIDREKVKARWNLILNIKIVLTKFYRNFYSDQQTVMFVLHAQCVHIS